MVKRQSLTKQVQDNLGKKLRIGESRHAAKADGAYKDGVYSWATYRTYLAHCCRFAKWAKANHGVRTLEEARPYVNAYIQRHIDAGHSAYTQKLAASALAKMYGCSSTDFIQTKVRRRVDITRSRLSKAQLCEIRNAEFIAFCKATGLRRSEITTLKLESLRVCEITGRYSLEIKGKGGRVRIAPILSDEAVRRILETPANQRVWPIVPSRADIHGMRAAYCARVYAIHARSIDVVPMDERYYARKDFRGRIYDKSAMRIASKALGHSRISVIAGNYLWAIEQEEAISASGLT